MAPHIYQGLFYLSLGAGSFLTLLLSLRTLSDKTSMAFSANARMPNENDWHHKEALTLKEVVDETADIKTFRFKRENNKPFPQFSPGQFLSFQIGDDAKCLRSYSLSASTLNNSTLQVSVKKLKDGAGSGWFHARQVGDKVYAFPPSGLFTDDKIGKSPRVFVAGGIGITPLLSMVLTQIDKAQGYPMALFYAARTSKDLAFHDQLALLARRHSNFKYFPVVSTGDENWKGEVGHLSLPYIKSKYELTDHTHYFFCGPPPLTQSIVEALVQSGVSENNLHSEKFASPQAFSAEKIPVRQVKVRYQGKAFDYHGRQTLLEFLESQGATPSFACRVGVCGTCKSQVKGSVETITDSGLSLTEKQKGMILTCVAFPKEDVEL